VLKTEDFLAYIHKNPNASANDVAKAFGCWRTTARDAEIRCGVRLRQKKAKIEPAKLKAYMQKYPNAGANDVANAFGTTNKAAYGALKRYDIPFNKRMELDIEKLRKYIEKHPKYSLRKIGEAFGGCSPSTVSKAIKRNKIKRKSTRKTR
jgi:hypothetical protein